MANIVSKLFNEDSRKLKQLEKRVQPILDAEEKYKNMSDDELKAMTPLLKEKLANGATLDDIYVEAFATAREAATATWIACGSAFPTSSEAQTIILRTINLGSSPALSILAR